MSDSPGKRLALFRKANRISQRSLAAGCGVSGGLVGQIEAGLIPPSRSFLQRISERYRVSADWLLNGTGDMLLAEQPGFPAQDGQIMPPDHAQPMPGDFRFGDEGFTMIRRMDLSVSAGSGLVAVEDGETETLAFPRTWLMRQRINPNLAVLVKVEGDSMSPGIPDGALVMIHLPEMQPDQAGVYAFNRGDVSYVKRIVPSLDAASGRVLSLVIASDNPAYPPEAVSGRALDEIRIIGRVRCVIAAL